MRFKYIKVYEIKKGKNIGKMFFFPCNSSRRSFCHLFYYSLVTLHLSFQNGTRPENFLLVKCQFIKCSQSYAVCPWSLFKFVLTSAVSGFVGFRSFSHEINIVALVKSLNEKCSISYYTDARAGR